MYKTLAMGLFISTLILANDCNSEVGEQFYESDVPVYTQTKPHNSDLLTTEAVQDLKKKRPELFGDDFKERASKYFKYLGGPEVTEEETEELRRIFADPEEFVTFTKKGGGSKFLKKLSEAGALYPWVEPYRDSIYVKYALPAGENDGNKLKTVILEVIKLTDETFSGEGFDRYTRIELEIWGRRRIDKRDGTFLYVTVNRDDIKKYTDNDELYKALKIKPGDNMLTEEKDKN